MRKEDPCALLYVDRWLADTRPLTAEARGYLISLVLNQFKYKSLPANMEQLSILVGVAPSLYQNFLDVYEKELKDFFAFDANGRLVNNFYDQVIKSRKNFTDKRSKSGYIGNIIKYWQTLENIDDCRSYVSKQLTKMDITELQQLSKNYEKLKDLLAEMRSQMRTLLIDIDININKDLIKDKDQSLKTEPPKKQNSDFKPSYSDFFLTWWQEYDRKIDQDDASFVWDKLSREEKLTAIKHTRKFVEVTPQQYRPNPVKYLKQRRFNNEIIDYSPDIKEANEASEAIQKLHRDFGIGTESSSNSSS